MKIFRITNAVSFPTYIRAENVKQALIKVNDKKTQEQYNLKGNYTENNIKEV